MSRATRATWVKRVEEWRQGGDDAASAAAKFGVTERTLKWWAWRLDRESSPSKPKMMTKPAPAATPSLTFVEMTRVARSEPVEIVLRNDLRVRVGAGFDDATLGRVLDLLERR
jgi:hypothetical protein